MGMIARAFDFSLGNRNLNNPDVPLQSAGQYLWDGVGGGTADSGAPVTQTSSMRLSAVYRCVRVLADSMGSLPLFVMRRQKPRGRVKATDHPLYPLLHLSPNVRHTSYSFRSVMQANVVLQGNGYAGIRRDRGGRIRDLWPIPATRVEVDPKPDGSVVYQVTVDGRRQAWGSEEILHIPGMGFDGVKGLSVLQAAREGIGLGLSLQKYGANVFSRGGRVPGVIQTDRPKLDDETRKNVAAGWDSSVGGVDNWHRPAIFPKGWEYKEIGIKPDDGQWVESKKLQILEICRYFGVNPHKVFGEWPATYANFEHSSLSHVIDTIQPWAICWEQELTRKLLTPAEQEEFFIAFYLQGLLRGDTAARGQFYSTGRQWGWLSANDVRELEDQTDIGDQGDIYLVPFNMQDAAQVNASALPTPAPTRTTLPAVPAPLSSRVVQPAPEQRSSKFLKLRRRIRAAQRPLIEDRAALILKREIGAIEKELKKLTGSDGRNRRDLTSLRAAIDEFYSTHDAWSAEKMKTVLLGFAQLLEGTVADELNQEAKDDLSPAMEKFTRDYLERFGKRHASEGRLQILALIDEHEAAGDEEVAAEMQQRLDEWGKKRSGKIADNETVRFSSAGVKTLYLFGGVTVYRWAANPGACDFCQSLDGKIAGVQQNFVNAGEGVDGGPDSEGKLTPSDNIGHPPLHGSCFCDVVPG